VRLRVLSYNIHRAIGVDRRFRPERVVSIISNYNPDVVMLQEVDEGVPRSRELDLARELARALGFPHYAIGHNVRLRKGRYGNATLSRWPIRRERNIDLTVGFMRRRGCQHTRIAVKTPAGATRRLEVFNMHLGLSARERERQVSLLVRSKEFAALPFGVPTLIAGDTNDWAATPAVRGHVPLLATGGNDGAARTVFCRLLPGQSLLHYAQLIAAPPPARHLRRRQRPPPGDRGFRSNLGPGRDAPPLWTYAVLRRCGGGIAEGCCGPRC
jgi:endonuclease/exonuclease/phosphatase family metal-dependent hydrolase